MATGTILSVLCFVCLTLNVSGTKENIMVVVVQFVMRSQVVNQKICIMEL